MFDKILIANRGEIACRVIKTARRMGIKTVAVFSDADAQSLHVKIADEAVHIGGSASSDSYLRIDRILDAIEQTGAQAVHPGFGFLSENAEFATALENAGVAFVGPGTHAIGAMGDKIESKKLADKVGVNTIPGHTEALADAEQAIAVAKDIGCPVMIKASAGGGGKGMRIAWSLNEVADGFTSAANEARNSFGDDRVFIEKYIETPRHIEIQILADKHGNCIYLNERECSIQRRHQKVIEEAPSPFIDAATRKAMGEQAVALAKAVDYCSAGTVEFVVDKERNFYFLEMNTRLQVEHPVTEYITGIDLVEQMIRVANNEALSLAQTDVKINGWALESRVYAEDPERNFLPSTGRLTRYLPPEENAMVRVDTGVYEGGEISMFYDPMIAKLITWGETRNDAIAAMADALDEYVIRGVSHNIPFLSALIRHPDFICGDLTTGFIAQYFPEGFSSSDAAIDNEELLAAVATSLEHQRDNRSNSYAPRQQRDYVACCNERRYTFTSRIEHSSYELACGKNIYRLQRDYQPGNPLLVIDVNGETYRLQVEKNRSAWRLSQRGFSATVAVLTPTTAALFSYMPEIIAADTSKMLLSPMPGLLVRLHVAVGDTVEAGQDLAVIEAMKMENSLSAERAGTVNAIKAQEGDSLTVDQVILEFE